MRKGERGEKTGVSEGVINDRRRKGWKEIVRRRRD